MILIWFWFFGIEKKCHESAMNSPWIWYIGLIDSWHFYGTFPMLFLLYFRVIFMANPDMAEDKSTTDLSWKCHENGMKCLKSCFSELPSRGNKSIMNLLLLCIADLWHFHDIFNQIKFQIILWLIYGRFIVLSWHLPLKTTLKRL